MKKLKDNFLAYMGDFLNVYLTKQRNVSSNTIIAIKQVWNMLLNYICDTKDKKIESVMFADFNREAVIGFLDSLEEKKNWSASTRNHRLSNIRSFFTYVSRVEPTLGIYLTPLQGIPLKKQPDKTATSEYMSKEAMKTVLQQPNTKTKIGLRDMFLMSLMYDTAARSCEILTLCFGDIDESQKEIVLMGKGSVERRIPIEDGTILLFNKYKHYFNPKNDETMSMFYVKRNNNISKMSHDNLAKFILKYGKLAKLECPEVPDEIHPHMIRTTRAMHWYQNGMPLEYIARLLGHKHLETTMIYARMDTKMKREAIEKAGLGNSVLQNETKPIWVGNEEMIKKLLGLGI